MRGAGNALQSLHYASRPSAAEGDIMATFDEPRHPGLQPRTEPRRSVERLLNKWAVERETSLDITTVYRKMKAGTFPQPVRIGKRRVAWRESDVAAWQATLGVGTRP